MRGAALWHGWHPAARGLALFAIANVLLLQAAVPLLTRTESSLRETGQVLGRPKVRSTDSWMPMNLAAVCLRQQPGRLLYDTLFFGLKTKFQYPPTSLLAAYPVLGRRADFDGSQLLHGVSWVGVFVTAGFVAAILWRGLVGSADPPWSRGDRWLLTLAGVALTLTFYPVVKAYALGQIQAWINALFAAAVWCWVCGRKGSAGVLAALMCLIKPQYGVLLVWGLLRREWRFVRAGALTGAVGLAASVWLFGFANHLDYLRVLSFISRHGESFHANQSVNGLLNRLLGNGDSLAWDFHAFAPFHPAVYAGTTVSSLAFLGIGLFGPQRRRAPGSALDFGAAALAATLASPVAWEHHYGILIPLYAVLFSIICRSSTRGFGLTILGVSYALTGNYFAVLNRAADTPFNFVQSYTLAGAVLALALLCRARVPAAATA